MVQSLMILLLALSFPLSSLADEEAAGAPVRFDRPDGAVLAGTLGLVDGEKRPAVLLLHQAQKSKEEFDFLLPDLHRLGFHTLAVDLRGHGESSRPAAVDRAFFMKLFTDPDYAPPDIEAILAWLADHGRVDRARIAVVGGSVGANLGFVAAGAGWPVKTAVVLSGNAENANLLAANIERFSPRNVLLMAADNDHGRDEYARQMYEQADEPKQTEILAGSSAHGAEILRTSPEMKKTVLDWLEKQLR